MASSHGATMAEPRCDNHPVTSLVHRPLLMCPVATQTALLEALTAEELGPEYINSSHRALVTGHVMLNYLTQFLI